MTPWQYLDSINSSKKNLMVDDVEEKTYASFVINRTLSYFSDTVLVANEMNQAHHIDNRLQYDFLRSIVRKKKRFTKWGKAEEIVDLEAVKQYYGYSNEKAIQALSLLTSEQKKEIRMKTMVGGRTRKHK